MSHTLIARESSEVLGLWERGYGYSPANRGCLLAGWAHPGASWSQLASMSIGERNRAVLELWSETFGARVDCLVDCPACGSRLELELNVFDLLGSSGAVTPGGGVAELSGYRVEYRPLCTADLVAVQDCASVEQARQALLARCVVEASVSAAELPEEVVAVVGEALANSDPLADIVLRTACAECGYSWSPGCDLVALVWHSVETAAGRMLDDIHVLAERYGWREADILALSPARRQAYLERLGFE